MQVFQPSRRGKAAGSVRRPALSRGERTRVVARAAVLPLLGSYAGTVALLGLVTAAAGAHVGATGVFFGALPALLAAYHVPLTLPGGSLGVLPLLPTALIVLVVATAAATAARRLDAREPADATAIVLTVAGVHAAAGATVAVLLQRMSPVAVVPAAAFFACGVVSGLAATIGVARRSGLVDAVLDRWDDDVVRGLRGGALGLAALAASGSAALAAGMLVHWPVTAALFAHAGQAGSGLGMLVLCLSYLPNAVVAAVSYLLGPGVSIGTVVAGPGQFTGGPLPGVPLLAALPAGASRWSPLVLVVPAVVGVGVGWWCRRGATEPVARLRTAVTAAGVVAGTLFVLAALTGGRLGGGPFDPVTVPAGLLGAVAFCWIAGPGALVAWLDVARWTGRRRAAGEPGEAAEPVEAPAGAAETGPVRTRKSGQP